VRPADRRRRQRRIILLLSAILIPTAVVVVLVVRVIRQDNELSERRASAQRRDTLDQLRRELSARLQALRLEEVNRLIGEPGRRVPDSPIVFVAPMMRDRMVLPWESSGMPPPPDADFVRRQREGETLEFQQRDAAGAAAAYRRALDAARTPEQACSARLWLGRVAAHAGLPAEAERADRRMLEECGGVADTDGVPFALYAAVRLVARGSDDGAAADYAIRSATMRQWHPPSEAYALQSLLRRLPGPAAADPLRKVTSEIHDIEQIVAFARDAHHHLDTLRRASRSAPGDLAWVGYGDEPWLLTLVSPSSFAAPVVMAVSSRRIAPAGVTIRVAPTAASAALGDGFVDLYAEWPPDRFAVSPSVPPAIHGAILVVVLGAALITGYLLLRDVHREADTAEMRSHFVASVSHELKTPLTSIRAHAETLLMGRAGGAETTAEYLRTIVSESERLARLVDSVLEFSRIEQGRKAYHMQIMRLEDVVRRAAATMEYPLAQMGFALTISSDGSEPTLRGDPEALTQAVLNLLGNAMKYSGEARTIELHLGTRGREAFVDVVDHGIGISRDDQSRIFERFHRVQSAATSGVAGTGLGLALARHVVEAHRGRIAVVSDLGRGSTFSVLIPLQEQA
jgi:signal transduction histidine kinase